MATSASSHSKSLLFYLFELFFFVLISVEVSLS